MPKKIAPLIEFSHAAGCEFHTPFAASRVDRANGIIREVGLITSGVKARGHELHVDDTTLAQMLSCANTRGKVPVKLNHPSAIENVCGYVTNFAIKGGKLVGDWHLLKSHEEYETMLERAERMPECFGMSAAFMGEEETAGGRRLARCEELIAFDCVAQPAAMPSGLFAAKNAARVGSQTGGMSKPTELHDPNAVPAEMPAWFQPFAEQLTRQGEQTCQGKVRHRSDCHTAGCAAWSAAHETPARHRRSAVLAELRALGGSLVFLHVAARRRRALGVVAGGGGGPLRGHARPRAVWRAAGEFANLRARSAALCHDGTRGVDHD